MNDTDTLTCENCGAPLTDLARVSFVADPPTKDHPQGRVWATHADFGDCVRYTFATRRFTAAMAATLGWSDAPRA